MQATISALHESESCIWCEKMKETVTVDFNNESFLKKGPLCWKCLQQAVKVYHKQNDTAKCNKPTSK